MSCSTGPARSTTTRTWASSRWTPLKGSWALMLRGRSRLPPLCLVLLTPPPLPLTTHRASPPKKTGPGRRRGPVQRHVLAALRRCPGEQQPVRRRPKPLLQPTAAWRPAHFRLIDRLVVRRFTSIHESRSILSKSSQNCERGAARSCDTHAHTRDTHETRTQHSTCRQSATADTHTDTQDRPRLNSALCVFAGGA